MSEADAARVIELLELTDRQSMGVCLLLFLVVLLQIAQIIRGPK